MKVVTCLLIMASLVSLTESYGASWTEWTHWGACGTSRSGFKIRRRTCEPRGGGCLGSYKQGMPCKKTHGYPVPGHWSDWTDFGACGTDTPNFQTRNRVCQPPGVGVCKGSYKQGKRCTLTPSYPKPPSHPQPPSYSEPSYYGPRHAYPGPSAPNPAPVPPYSEPGPPPSEPVPPYSESAGDYPGPAGGYPGPAGGYPGHAGGYPVPDYLKPAPAYTESEPSYSSDKADKRPWYQRMFSK